MSETQNKRSPTPKAAHPSIVLITKLILWSLALIAAATSLSAISFGPAGLVAVQTISSSVDSEYRFLASSWLGVGACALWSTFRLDVRYVFLPAIAAVLLLGSAARAVSWYQTAEPVAKLVIAMCTEFTYAILLFAMYFPIRAPLNRVDIND